MTLPFSKPRLTCTVPKGVFTVMWSRCSLRRSAMVRRTPNAEVSRSRNSVNESASSGSHSRVKRTPGRCFFIWIGVWKASRAPSLRALSKTCPRISPEMSSKLVSNTATWSVNQSCVREPSVLSLKMALKTLGRVLLFRVPSPYPMRWALSESMGPKDSTNSAKRAAPVGVTNSWGSSHWVTPMPRAASISRVAVVGMGNRPWAQFTKPVPSTTRALVTRGWPSSSRQIAAPTMSTMESTAPTSWK